MKKAAALFLALILTGTMCLYTVAFSYDMPVLCSDKTTGINDGDSGTDRLNDPTADTDGAVNCTMALVDFMRYFTGRAIALRAKPRDLAANRPLRLRCELEPGQQPGTYYFSQHGQRDALPDNFAGWIACAAHDGVAHATTAHRSFVRMERTEDGGVRFLPEVLAAGGRFSVYAVDQTGRMRVAEVRLPKPHPAPEQPVTQAQDKPDTAPAAPGAFGQ